jgi:hypothetical protein
MESWKRQMPSPTAERRRPRAGKIRSAVEYSGIGRSRLYELAIKHRGLFRKNGNATIVDFNVLDAIIDALPHAKIKQTKEED